MFLAESAALFSLKMEMTFVTHPRLNILSGGLIALLLLSRAVTHAPLVIKHFLIGSIRPTTSFRLAALKVLAYGNKSLICILLLLLIIIDLSFIQEIYIKQLLRYRLRPSR